MKSFVLKKGIILMFKLTLYKKVNLSRNFFLLIFIACLIAVSGKIVLAHEKMNTYKEAMRLFKSGEMAAAEKKFRAAKLNVVITDHNKDINRKLAILSPIREEMEILDKDAADFHRKDDLDHLAATYERWQKSSAKWVSGTAVQKDMYEEMLALTELDKDLEGYFSAIKKTEFAKLKTDSIMGDTDEDAVFLKLKKVPAEYYGGDEAKTTEIHAAFHTYYTNIMNKLMAAAASVADLVNEGNRQFGMLSQFSMDNQWLKDTLDAHLLEVLTAAVDKQEYADFAGQANTVQKLSVKMNEAKVLAFIERTKTKLLNNAKNLTAANKFADAIAIYEALKPLEDTADLIKAANLGWDHFEPVRVLQRLYPDQEFPHVVNAKNKWGADSVVAAISKDGKIYFGKQKGEEPMAVTEGRLDNASAITKLDFQSDIGSANLPVIFIDAKSSSRKHHYLAYEIRSNTMGKILDVEADHLTIEARGMIVVENPAGQGEGELAYYEADASGVYRFTKIKTDYTDIQVKDIINYYGKKVRFTVYNTVKNTAGPLVKISETFNATTGRYETSYLLLKGELSPSTLNSYKVIGVWSSNQTITNEYGEAVEVPVFQVGKIE